MAAAAAMRRVQRRDVENLKVVADRDYFNSVPAKECHQAHRQGTTVHPIGA
jgi:hypothetical protein